MNTHKSQGQDFRSMAYGKAISALRNFPRKIECTEVSFSVLFSPTYEINVELLYCPFVCRM